MIIPLPLFPAWAQPLLYFLPFQGMADAPFRLYLGHLPPGTVWGGLLHQLLWTAAFVWLGLRSARARNARSGGAGRLIK